MGSDAKNAAESCTLIFELAREAVKAFVTESRIIEPSAATIEALSIKAACFVSLKLDGQLRGCIGTLAPTCENLASEIIHNAIAACSRDPRFAPVTAQELPSIKYSVDVLDAPEPVSTIDELDPEQYGVIVSKGASRGVLLPNLEGIDSAAIQVDIARQKAGISDTTNLSLQRFKVLRCAEES